MPPRKSDVSKVATADEATPAKDQAALREGINIEVGPLSIVQTILLQTIGRRHNKITRKRGQFERGNCEGPQLIQFPGSQSPKECSNEAGKGCSAAQHTNPGKRHASHDQERNSIRQLPS